MDIPGNDEADANGLGIRNFQVQRAGLVFRTAEIELMHQLNGAGHRRTHRPLRVAQRDERESEEQYPHCRDSLQALSWWRNLLPRGAEPPLIEVPTGDRFKSYLAESGFEYQYRFGGRRQLPKGNREYRFCLPDRSVSILEDHSVLADWQQASEHILTDPERLAIATMVLRRTMDEAASPADLPSTTTVDGAVLTEIAEMLDL